MTIEIWLTSALLISIGINIILAWFSKEQSGQLLYVSENIGDLVELLSSYKEHLRKVYGLEMFYGDETLKGLMDHTNALVLLIQQEYGEITYITDPLTVPFEKEEEVDEEEQEEQEKDVFYGGTRTSDS